MTLNIYISLLFFLFNYLLAYKEYPYSLILAYESLRPATYIRFATSENGLLYIVTGEDTLDAGKRHRYIIIYDINTASFVKKISYESNFGFWRGEPYFVGDSSQYLFITTFYDEYNEESSFEILDINKLKTKQKLDSELNGYRRGFVNSRPYYYYMFLKLYENDGWYITLKKMYLVQKDNFPEFQIYATNEHKVKIEYQAMISCDKSPDDSYIFCAYYSEDAYVAVSVFTKQLGHINEKKFEKAGYKMPDRFIKIFYLKGSYNFILMNSQTETISRLRYFNYQYNAITDKLASITKKTETYLDIYNTQYYGFNGDNDLIAVDSNKIIKLYSGDKIIITIIQFYENDSKMTIRIYYMYNNNGFPSICQGRIAMLKNSIVIGGSSSRNNLHKPGYFIINYPNSTDINLVERSVSISKLISLENPIFNNIKLKLKVLNIPTDYIFINKLNSKIINENDELELNDEIILRQYRINEGNYILDYESIARGPDSGYSYYYIYPPNSYINYDDVLLEGRKGKIIINLKDCLNGYYHLYRNMNVCTNIKPKNYYIDEINKTYKPCSSFCDECNPPTKDYPMNCINCINNYFITEDTYSCYTGEIP